MEEADIIIIIKKFMKANGRVIRDTAMEFWKTVREKFIMETGNSTYIMARDV